MLKWKKYTQSPGRYIGKFTKEKMHFLWCCMILMAVHILIFTGNGMHRECGGAGGYGLRHSGMWGSGIARILSRSGEGKGDM